MKYLLMRYFGFENYSLGLATAVLVARTTGLVSRRLGKGAGVALAGKVLIGLQPNCLGDLAQGLDCVLVSATNGKTTTTAMCAASLMSLGPVVTNDLGNNMSGGIAVALANRKNAKRAVLEVDEAHLETVAAFVEPSHVILMNLSRDQLDRVSEVRSLANRWAKVVQNEPDTTFIANISDPLIHFATLGAKNIVKVSLGLHWKFDAVGCPVCDSALEFDSNQTYRCTSCGFAKPMADYVLHGHELICPDKTRIEIAVNLPGDFNLGNAAMALILANLAGVDMQVAKQRVLSIDNVAGRYKTFNKGDKTISLMMAKNPAGWAAILDSVEFSGKSIVLGLNAEIADGKDTSWIYDVDFSPLGSYDVVATGQRAFDLSVRLGYAGVAHRVSVDQQRAISMVDSPNLVYLGNYTAFQSLRKTLGHV